MMDLPSVPVAPKPEVQHLPTIFRRVAVGELRIPAFQREFVWSSGQMLSLLDSVFRGFPISSLLFWRVMQARLKTQEKRNFPLAKSDAPFPHLFVLDGLQRLTTLYGVFNFTPEQFDPQFNVVFDLREEKFMLASEAPADSPAFLPLNHVFNPRSFLNDQKVLLDLENGSELVNRAIRLHSVFQEYMLPLVTIESENVEDVVRIFERINNTGTRLSSVDFLRAVTWSEEFDLSDELRQMADHFEDLGFEFDEETLVKCLAIALERDPTATSMLSLQSCTDDELHDGVRLAQAALDKVVAFFQKNFGIAASEFIPYEAHIVVLTKFFSGPDPSRFESQARRWFLASAIDESLRGRSDAFVSGLMRQIDEANAGRSDVAFDVRMTTTSAVFYERRFIRGRALSAASILLFALRGAKSLITGKAIQHNEYLRSIRPSSLEPIFEYFQIGRASFGSQRRIANLALVSVAEARPRDLRQFIVENEKRLGSDVLNSQFLSSHAMNALQHDDYVEFAFDRADAMMHFAESLIDESIPWPSAFELDR